MTVPVMIYPPKLRFASLQRSADSLIMTGTVMPLIAHMPRMLGSHAGFLELLGHFHFLQRLGKLEQVTIEGSIHVVGGEADAVVGDTRLGEVIGADFF